VFDRVHACGLTPAGPDDAQEVPMPATLSRALPLAADPISSAGNTQLVLACLAGIAVIVVLITWLKMHPFLALIVGSAALAAVAWIDPSAALMSFTTGFGSTAGAVGILIALGAMLGKILADSGGADNIVNRITDRLSGSKLPWGMALIAAIIGLPLFFEVGVVILVPVVILVARRTHSTLMKVGIPALAGLSVLHGLVPPHPGPQTAIALLKADQSRTLVFGILVAIPTLIISGPLLGRLMDRWVPVYAPASLGEPAIDARAYDRELQTTSVGGGSATADGPGRDRRPAGGADEGDDPGLLGTQGVDTAASRWPRRPSFGAALITIVLPVLLMLLKAISDLATEKGSTARQIFDTIGAPAIALLLAVLLSYFTLGRGAGMRREEANESLGSGLPAIAGILLIVAAGGGFKQLLVDAGVANVIADWATGKNISVLLLGWLVAVGIRLATGSATVATTTAAGIVGGLAGTLSASHLALLVLAIGCGSLFFSHVNDAGFWLVKQYFGLTVGQTIKSWSVMETVISVVGFVFVMLLSLIF
jgi:gluconate:H+ symporter, GntP family